jgi:hypothetical protein
MQTVAKHSADDLKQLIKKSVRETISEKKLKAQKNTTGSESAITELVFVLKAIL